MITEKEIFTLSESVEISIVVDLFGLALVPHFRLRGTLDVDDDISVAGFSSDFSSPSVSSRCNFTVFTNICNK